jgi:hypothetical protein
MDEIARGERRTTPFETIALLLQGEVRSALIRQVLIRPWPKQAFIRTGWLGFRSVQSMRRSSPATHPINAPADYASFGRLSASPQSIMIILS